MTELDILGGNFYINSEWSLRKLGEMRRRGLVDDFWIVHIHADTRLKALIDDPNMGETYREEARRRWSDALFKRVEQNVPEEAAAAAIAYIVLPGGGHPIKGCKWGGNGTSVRQARGGGATAPNPIVENNAALSVESQAIRRAMRQVASAVGDLAPDFEKIESELSGITARAAAVVQDQARIDERAELEHHEPRRLSTQGFLGYAPEHEAPAEVPDAAERARQIAEAQRAAQMADPYAAGEAPRENNLPTMADALGLAKADRENIARNLADTGGTITAHFAVGGGEVIDLALAGELAPPIGTEPAQPGRMHVEEGRVVIDRPATPLLDSLGLEDAEALPCGECRADVRPRHPEDHKPSCSKYAD
jgi:hypothetical protein